jgi:hypothetical protein
VIQKARHIESELSKIFPRDANATGASGSSSKSAAGGNVNSASVNSGVSSAMSRLKSKANAGGTTNDMNLSVTF